MKPNSWNKSINKPYIMLFTFISMDLSGIISICTSVHHGEERLALFIHVPSCKLQHNHYSPEGWLLIIGWSKWLIGRRQYFFLSTNPPAFTDLCPVPVKRGGHQYHILSTKSANSFISCCNFASSIYSIGPWGFQCLRSTRLSLPTICFIMTISFESINFTWGQNKFYMCL